MAMERKKRKGGINFFLFIHKTKKIILDLCVFLIEKRGGVCAHFIAAARPPFFSQSKKHTSHPASFLFFYFFWKKIK
jgi:hypothetical protein